MELFEKSNINQEPIKRISDWLEEAISEDVSLPHAMSLATVDINGNPSNRMVLLKSISDTGLIFFTDFSSQKGSDISQNPNVAVTFWWPKLNKQIRVTGNCSKVSDDYSDDYFKKRPRGSKISASISNQSSHINSYEELVKKASIFDQENEQIRRPERWGGILIKPEKIEFWINKENRLHVRELFIFSKERWSLKLLAP